MVTADSSVGEMKEEIRQCRSHDDEPSISRSKIFSRYTYSSCLFECKLKNLNGAMEDCQPWDTPQEADPIQVCQKKGDDYARETMRRDPRCNTVIFK